MGILAYLDGRFLLLVRDTLAITQSRENYRGQADEQSKNHLYWCGLNNFCKKHPWRCIPPASIKTLADRTNGH